MPDYCLFLMFGHTGFRPVNALVFALTVQEAIETYLRSIDGVVYEGATTLYDMKAILSAMRGECPVPESVPAGIRLGPIVPGSMWHVSTSDDSVVYSSFVAADNADHALAAHRELFGPGCGDIIYTMAELSYKTMIDTMERVRLGTASPEEVDIPVLGDRTAFAGLF